MHEIRNKKTHSKNLGQTIGGVYCPTGDLRRSAAAPGDIVRTQPGAKPAFPPGDFPAGLSSAKGKKGPAKGGAFVS
jgi:hypothetical protein